MIPLTYLKSSDRRLLQKLNERIERCKNADLRREMNDQANEIEKRRKSLAKCSLEECEDFRQFVYDKYMMALQISSPEAAQQFQGMITRIEERMAIIQNTEYAESLREEISRQTMEDEGVVDSAIAKRRHKAKPVDTQSNQWIIDLDDED